MASVESLTRSNEDVINQEIDLVRRMADVGETVAKARIARRAGTNLVVGSPVILIASPRRDLAVAGLRHVGMMRIRLATAYVRKMFPLVRHTPMTHVRIVTTAMMLVAL